MRVNIVELDGSTEGSFWLGVTGLDEAGNQHDNHQGEVTVIWIPKMAGSR